MEDKHFLEDDIYISENNKDNLKMSMFGVLDGHRGEKVVGFCCNLLPKMIKKQFINYNKDNFPKDEK